MQGLIDFFAGFGDLISSIADFYIGMWKDLGYVIGLLYSIIAKIPVLVSWLPHQCITISCYAFGVIIVYKILGREG